MLVWRYIIACMCHREEYTKCYRERVHEALTNVQLACDAGECIRRQVVEIAGLFALASGHQ